jgi:hypothetical protein
LQCVSLQQTGASSRKAISKLWFRRNKDSGKIIDGTPDYAEDAVSDRLRRSGLRRIALMGAGLLAIVCMAMFAVARWFVT